MTAFLDWESLRNPIYANSDWAVKDACMVYNGTYFYLFFSGFYLESGLVRSYVLGVRTSNFREYSEPIFKWSGQKAGWIGMCSPNITRIGDRYVLTYNSWGDKPGKPNQLFYAESTDLESWDIHKPLAAEITSGKRAIDAAVISHKHRIYLLWKEFQTPQMAWAESMDGLWHRLEKPCDEWLENGQLIEIDEQQYMVLTAKKMIPNIAVMNRDGSCESHWVNWQERRRLEIPREVFNTHEAANAGFLADWRDYDGYFYFIYAGTTEGKSFAGRGDCKLGIARSKDLERWYVPPE